jgi:hypothetical protein
MSTTDAPPPDNMPLAQVTASDGRDDAGIRGAWGVAGWLIGGALLGVQISAPAVLQAGDTAAFLALAAREGALLRWPETGHDGPGWLALFCLVTPMAVPPVFGGWRHLPLRSPFWRGLTFATALVATVLSLAMAAASDGRNGRYITEQGAGWVRRGVVLHRAAWSDAVAVRARCDMEEHRRSRYADFVYAITFTGGRSLDFTEGDLEIGRFAGLAWVDGVLRRAGTPRDTSLDEECLVRLLPGRHRDTARLRAALTP